VSEVAVGLGLARLEPDRLAVCGDGLVVPALVNQGVTEKVVSIEVVGLEPDRLAEDVDGVFECLAGFPRSTKLFQLLPQAAKVSADPGTEPGQVPEDLNRLIGFALAGQGVGQFVGGLGTDGAGGGVEADGVVATLEFFQ
jgi:hypothetical protein